jgi:hypothetical protein
MKLLVIVGVAPRGRETWLESSGGGPCDQRRVGRLNKHLVWKARPVKDRVQRGDAARYRDRQCAAGTTAVATAVATVAASARNDPGASEYGGKHEHQTSALAPQLASAPHDILSNESYLTYVASAAATREIRITYFCNHSAPAQHGRWIYALHWPGTFVISMSVNYLTLIDVGHVGRSDDESLLLFFSEG